MLVNFTIRGKFTCFKDNGQSVIDYLLVQENLFNSLVFFEIGDKWPDSDHCPVTFHLKATFIGNSKFQNKDSISRGVVILLAESRKSSKKVPENRKKYIKCARKPENAILGSRKVEKKSAERSISNTSEYCKFIWEYGSSETVREHLFYEQGVKSSHEFYDYIYNSPCGENVGKMLQRPSLNLLLRLVTGPLR